MSERRDPPATPPNTKRCTNCGALNKVDAAWCSQCLKRFETADAEDVRAETAERKDVVPPAARQRRRWTIAQILAASVAGALALFGLAIVAYFILLSIALSSWGSTK